MHTASIKKLKKGQDIEAVMLSVDIERERIALSIKQLSEDPFLNYVSQIQEGNKVTGTVTNVQQNGATVSLTEKINGFIHVSDISDEYVENALDKIKVNDEITCYIANIDRKKRSINLSMQKQSNEPQKYFDNNTQPIAPTTIGDLIKDKLKK